MATEGAARDLFGSSVAVSGNFILAGMPQRYFSIYNDIETQLHGAAYFFAAVADDGEPKIQSVEVQGKKLIVKGTNFEAPSIIFLNGAKQKKAANDEANPTTVVIGLKAGKLIAPGQTVAVQVKNTATGKFSSEFIFTRPLE